MQPFITTAFFFLRNLHAIQSACSDGAARVTVHSLHSIRELIYMKLSSEKAQLRMLLGTSQLQPGCSTHGCVYLLHVMVQVAVEQKTMQQSHKGVAVDTSVELPLHVKRLVWERSKQVCMQPLTLHML